MLDPEKPRGAAEIEFTKVESIGNDFPMIELWEAERLSAAAGCSLDQSLEILAIKMSDRHFGIGGDGLLAISRGADEITLRMFNPDGTEDFCGNGLRCAASYAVAKAWVGNSFSIAHGGQTIETRILEDRRIETVLGPADYTPSRVPHKAGHELWNQTVWSGMDSGMPLSLFGSALTTGSTHVVIPTHALPDDDSFRSVSRKIEHDPLYPARTSVIWREEIAPMRLRIRIWERGVGETQGCGTGSSAAAADYLRTKRAAGTVEVENPGGTVWVTANSWDQPIRVVGTAKILFSGRFQMPLRSVPFVGAE